MDCFLYRDGLLLAEYLMLLKDLNASYGYRDGLLLIQRWIASYLMLLMDTGLDSKRENNIKHKTTVISGLPMVTMFCPFPFFAFRVS